MAQKLHDTYKFSYDKLKVLLGGWNTWKEFHIEDPKNYPTVPDPLPDQATPIQPIQPIQVTAVVGTPAPAKTTPKP